jgi:Transposase DDE domain
VQGKLRVSKNPHAAQEFRMDMLRLFYDCDEFCRKVLPPLQTHRIEVGQAHRRREPTLSVSEVMTILILFQTSGFRNLKTFYLQYVCLHLTRAFPHRVSYSRFVELEAEALLPLAAFLTTRLGRCTGLSFIDSTPLKVCHNLRIKSHKVFKDIAQRGVSSTGWFYGFKVHLVITDCGDLLAVQFTPGNVDDRKPVPKLARRLWGKLFGDRGYISHPLFTQLWAQGVQLITRLKKKMQPRLLPLLDKILLRKRTLIETVNDQLKNICQLEHSRHRSLTNGVVNVLAALIAYTYQEKKPSLHFTDHEVATLPAVVL